MLAHKLTASDILLKNLQEGAVEPRVSHHQFVEEQLAMNKKIRTRWTGNTSPSPCEQLEKCCHITDDVTPSHKKRSTAKITIGDHCIFTQIKLAGFDSANTVWVLFVMDINKVTAAQLKCTLTQLLHTSIMVSQQALELLGKIKITRGYLATIKETKYEIESLNIRLSVSYKTMQHQNLLLESLDAKEWL